MITNDWVGMHLGNVLFMAGGAWQIAVETMDAFVLLCFLHVASFKGHDVEISNSMVQLK